MFYFRVVPDGDEWLCKRGARVLERCPTVAAAMHLAELEASAYRPSQVLLHDEEGDVVLVCAFSSMS